MKINLEDILVKLICLFPITVLLQVYNTSLNRILFSLIMVTTFLLLVFNNKEKGGKLELMSLIIFFSIVLLFCSVLYSYFITEKPLINFNDCFYLPFWTIFLLYLAKRSAYFDDKMSKNINFIKAVLIIFGCLLILLLIINHNYFSIGRHRMASGAFLAFIEGLLLYTKTRQKNSLIYMILPFIACVFGFSRTYVVMILIVVLLFVYSSLKRKEMFIFKIFPFLLIVAFLYLNSDVFDRFFYSKVGNFDYLGSMTSGRSVFWEKDLEYFMNLPLFYKIFGVGYNAIYNVNSTVIASIYAHNDLINISFSNGLIGLYLYLFSFFYYFKGEKKRKYINKMSMYIIMFIFFFNGFFNGEYNYPAAVFAIPILMSIFKTLSKIKTNNNVIM